jgi:hypothetical protein
MHLLIILLANQKSNLIAYRPLIKKRDNYLISYPAGYFRY